MILSIFRLTPALANKGTLEDMRLKERRSFLLLVVGAILLCGACEKPNSRIATPSAMPNLIGLSYKDAQEALLRTPLEGKLTYEDLIDDRVVWKESNWIVVSQEPNPEVAFESIQPPCVGIVKKDEVQNLDDIRKLVCSNHTTNSERFQTTTTTTTTTTSIDSTITTPSISREEILIAADQMRSSKDEVQNSYFWTDKTSPVKWADSIYLYVATKNGYEPTIRMYVSYYGSDWIFWSNLILNIDGDIYEIEARGVNQDNTNMVYEWIDVVPSDSQLLLLEMVANSQKTLVRLEGDTYKHDFEVTPNQKRALMNVLSVYEGFRRGVLISP